MEIFLATSNVSSFPSDILFYINIDILSLPVLDINRKQNDIISLKYFSEYQ